MNTKAQQAGGLATSALILLLAASGCSTNHTPGGGQPSMAPPAAPASTPGSSSGTSGNPPMTSAYSPGANVDRAEDAAAIMASHQRERYLGPIDPAGVQSGPTPPTGQFIPPSAYANPEVTVNASISSPATPVVISGPDGDAGLFIAPAGTGAASVGGATANATIGTTAPANTTLITPTTAAMTATPGQFAAGPTVTQSNIGATTNTSLSPTMSSAVIPSPNQASSSAGTTISNIATSSGLAQTPTMSSAAIPSPNVAANNTAGTTITNATTTPSRVTLTPTMSSAAIPSPNVAANLPQRTVRATTLPVVTRAASATKVSATRSRVTIPIRVVSSGNGTVTVTNVSTPPVVIK